MGAVNKCKSISILSIKIRENPCNPRKSVFLFLGVFCVLGGKNQIRSIREIRETIQRQKNGG